MDWIVSPHWYVEALTCNVNIFGQWDFKEVIKVKWGHQGEPWSSSPGVLIRRVLFLWEHTEEGRVRTQ